MSQFEKNKLGILLFPGFEILDVFGPLEMFSALPERVDIILISEKNKLIESAQKISVQTQYIFSDNPEFDILLVPGGMGTRTEINNSTLVHWIQEKLPKTKLILSVCTGAALLAKAGVLDGLKATTNKRAFDWVVQQSNKVKWQKKARWVEDKNIITSSGIAAGMDMSLFVIAKLYGNDAAKSVCEKTEYIWNQNSNDDPFAI